jgi:hypothetical protein
MPSPEVLDGMRQPRSVRLEDIRRSTDAANALPTPNPALSQDGVTVYMSPSRRYLVEVQNIPAYVHEGRRYPAKRIAAQFEDGIYRNGAPGTDGYRKPEIKKLIDESLQSNRYFGAFTTNMSPAVHFWLASDMLAVTDAAKVKHAMDTLRSVPREQLEARLAELRQGDAEDHDFSAGPAAEPSGRRITKPIAPTA